MNTKNYRCLTCGFVIDCYEDQMMDNAFLREHFDFITVEDDLACPGCLHIQRVLKERKPGEIRKPKVETPGKLVPETPEVKTRLEVLERDFKELNQGNARSADKYATERIFGFTGYELLALKAERDSREAGG